MRFDHKITMELEKPDSKMKLTCFLIVIISAVLLALATFILAFSIMRHDLRMLNYAMACLLSGLGLDCLGLACMFYDYLANETKPVPQ